MLFRQTADLGLRCLQRYLSVSFFFLVIRRRRSERMTDGVDADERDKVSA